MTLPEKPLLAWSASVIAILGVCFIAWVHGPKKKASAVMTDAHIRFSPVLEILIVDPSAFVDGLIDAASKTLYLVSDRKIRRIDWQANDRGTWNEMERQDCPSRDPHITLLQATKTDSHLLVLDCGRVELIDNRSFGLVRVIAGSSDEPVDSPTLSPDGRFLAVFSVPKGEESEDIVRVFDTRTWQIVAKWKANVSSLRFTPDGKLLAGVFARSPDTHSIFATECGITFFDFRNGKNMSEWSVSISDDMCPTDPFLFIRGDPLRVVTNVVSQDALSVWDAQTGRLLRQLRSDHSGTGPPPFVDSLSASEDGRLVALTRTWNEPSSGPESELQIWDMDRGEDVHSILPSGQADSIVRIRFSSEGNYLLLTSTSKAILYAYNTF